MPIYEFRCPRCNHQFEELVFRQSEIAELTCPKCGSEEIRQLMSAFTSSSNRPSGGNPSCGPGSFS